ncbi:ATP-binding protein [Oricola nitratireducens]|uniref:ATP-binding protein n=1 Tax=Oricola nitratireducens TaxID=2775868 RepID=UPI00186857AE|nr:ATP-binding protein [Oricola nitratireducens]
MRVPHSLQARLGLSIGLLLMLLWIGAALFTANLLRQEMDKVFDSTLQETAQRLLPLAVLDIVGREEEGIAQRLAAIRVHEEFFTYIVRDDRGRILLQSHAADPTVFPPYDGSGFAQTATHRLYSDEALQGTIRITVAEPLEHRATIARGIEMGLGLPILFVIPTAFIVIALAVRTTIAPVRRFRERLQARDERDLTHVPIDDLPAEIVPLAATLNALLSRLKAAFDAERSFAANAAHELRTPLAGAMAQAQRLQIETAEPVTARRAADIEAALKRLTRRTERLMQLARAEGAQLRLDRTSDLRMAIRVVVEDVRRAADGERVSLRLPAQPVVSDLDPDVVGILCRNLLENALRHGSRTAPVEVTLKADGELTVVNEGPVVAPEKLARITDRFERASGHTDGSGLGLAIVTAIAERIGSPLLLSSPRSGQVSGFEASLRLPTSVPEISGRALDLE